MRTAAVEKENYGKSNLAYTAGRNVRIKPAATPITDQCTRGDEQMLDNIQQCRVDPTPRREQKCSGPYIQVPLTPLSTSPAASGRPLPAAAPDPAVLAGRGGLIGSHCARSCQWFLRSMMMTTSEMLWFWSSKAMLSELREH
ncbi:unnamed protein product [Urochloa humidicola]